jgi:hypothetical protein
MNRRRTSRFAGTSVNGNKQNQDALRHHLHCSQRPVRVGYQCRPGNWEKRKTGSNTLRNPQTPTWMLPVHAEPPCMGACGRCEGRGARFEKVIAAQESVRRRTLRQ